MGGFAKDPRTYRLSGPGARKGIITLCGNPKQNNRATGRRGKPIDALNEKVRNMQNVCGRIEVVLFLGHPLAEIAVGGRYARSERSPSKRSLSVLVSLQSGDASIRRKWVGRTVGTTPIMWVG